jgi:hypothetical protein
MANISSLLRYREGRNNIYELLPPPWTEFWKKPTAVRLTAGQIDVLAATPNRDSSGLFIIGRIAQGTMQVYDPKLKRFVPFLDGLAAADFTLSPDKKWMVYADYPRRHLWRSKLDGSEKLQLTDFYSWMPKWSPDSKKIVFSDRQEIYMVSVDGGAPEKLTSEGKIELAPNWWPDGKSIVFNDYPLPGQMEGLKVLDLAPGRYPSWGARPVFMRPPGRRMEDPWWQSRRIRRAWCCIRCSPVPGRTYGHLIPPGDTGSGPATVSLFTLP